MNKHKPFLFELEENIYGENGKFSSDYRLTIGVQVFLLSREELSDLANCAKRMLGEIIE